jgi:hypothetical protein
MTTKRLTRAFYVVTMRPNTDAVQVAFDLMSRLSDSSRPMHVLSMWSTVSDGATSVTATVRYEARGANGNDIWRRVCTATPLSKAQVEVVELATFNLDAETAAAPAAPW